MKASEGLDLKITGVHEDHVDVKVTRPGDGWAELLAAFSELAKNLSAGLEQAAAQMAVVVKAYSKALPGHLRAGVAIQAWQALPWWRRLWEWARP